MNTRLARRGLLEVCSFFAALGFAFSLAACGEAREAPGEEASPRQLPLTWEAIFRDASMVNDAVLSPDGRQVAVVIRDQGVTRLQLRGLAGSAPSGATQGTGASGGIDGARSPAWSPDGHRLAWLSADEVWIADLPATGGIGVGQNLVSLEGARHPAWSPDGRQLALFGTASGSQDLWLVDAKSGELRQLTEGAAEVDDARFTPQWSPDGRWLAYVSNEADWWHDDLWIVEVATAARHRISRHLMASSSPVWSPASTPQRATLVAMGTAKDGYWYQDLADLYRIELDLGGGAPRVLSEEAVPMQVHATDFIMRLDPFFSSDGSQVFFPYHQRGAFDLWAVPISGGVATRVTNVGGAWSTLRVSADRSSAVFVREAPREGKEAWTVSLAAGKARPATALSTRFEGEQVPREVSLRSFDGLYLQGFLYVPPQLPDVDASTTGSGGSSCPSLVQVHGGGTNSYYQGRNLTEQVLAARGFVVLAINYRGGSGFGRAFQDLAVEDWLNDQSKDPGAAADWLRAQSFSNRKVGIYGGSYGGMQSMSAITRTPEKFQAAVPMRGIYSEALTLPFADRLGKIFTVTGHGGTPEQRPDTYAKSETLDRLQNVTAPVLVMHGEHDVRAPFRNFELAVEKLAALGKEFESKTYDEGHAFRDPDNLVDMYQRLEDFFGKHLGACR